MAFASLFFFLIGITLLYAGWKNVSPFVVIKAFIEDRPVDEYKK